MNEEVFSVLVETVDVDDIGTLRLSLGKGVVIKVFPCGSREKEHWRFFKCGAECPHWVYRDEDWQEEKDEG